MRASFSRRSSWPSEENALSIALTSRRDRGLEVLDLTASNPTCAGFDYPPATILSPLVDTRALVYRPDPLGIPAAREAVARHYARRGIEVDPQRVMITASSSESYSFLFALLADPGDEILIPRPSYPLLSFLADLSVLKLVPYDLSRLDGWRPEPSIGALITDRTRAIVSVSPNNPTGSFLDTDSIELLSSIAAARSVALIQDEVFSSYTFGSGEPAPSVASHDRCLTFALDGLSKAAALPQMKLGWIVVNGPRDLVDEALSRLALIADTFLSVATPVQYALPALLDAAVPIVSEIRARTARNLALVQRAFRAPHLARVWPVDAGWYATIQVPATRSDDAWALAALDLGVLVQPGHFYDYPPSVCTLVISLLTPEPAFAEGVARLSSMLSA